MTKEQKYKAFFEAIARLNAEGVAVTISPGMNGTRNTRPVIWVGDSHHHFDFDDGVVAATNWLNDRADLFLLD